MEYIAKPRQKLSLSSGFSKLQNVLLEQKRQNCLLEKENVILNTKISSMKKNPIMQTVKDNERCFSQKQKLKQVYQQIKNQQRWIKEANSIMEQKIFEKEHKIKIKIEKKLKKTTKKCKEMSKKLNNLQVKVDEEQNQMKIMSKFLGSYEENQEKRQISSEDVAMQLQKQNQQLRSLLVYKENQLNQENRKVNSLNSKVIELLALKNYLRKYATQIKKESIDALSMYSSAYKMPSSSKSQMRDAFKLTNPTSNKNLKSSETSIFRQQLKLKIATY